MPYSSWTRQSTATTASATNVNLLADTIYTYTKGGLSTVQPIVPLNSVPSGEIRQTVLYASVSSSGNPNYLYKGSSHNIIFGADTSTGVYVSFANRLNEYLVKFSSNEGPSGWSGLSTNATWYLYVTYYSSDGQSSFGISSLAPNYLHAFPSTAGTVNRHVFIIPKMQMYYDDGVAWTNINRVFVGEVEVTTGGVSTNSTTVRNYALKGQWRSGWQYVESSVNYQWFHNIGLPLAQGLEVLDKAVFSTTATSTYGWEWLGLSVYYFPALITFLGKYNREVSTSYDTRNYIKFGYNNWTEWGIGTVLASGYADIYIKRIW